MPTFTARKVVNDAKTILQDTTGVRWSDAELLGWVNAGQREIVALRPDTNPKTVGFATVGGNTRQIIPADGYAFIDAPLGPTGQAITPIPKELMDRLDRGWRGAAPTTDVKHYVFDPRTPKFFYLYPPAPAGAVVELIYAVAPADLTSLDQLLALDDIYVNPLTDYVLYRAYSKDLETVGSVERAGAARLSFENTLGLKAQADAATVARSAT